MNKKIIVSIVVIFAVLICWISPIKFLINFAHDDSFYYLKIADNFAKGYGSTFDRVNITNGYHPLWFLILSVVFYICNLVYPFNSDSLFRVVFFLHIILCWLSTLFVFKTFSVVDKKLNKMSVKLSFLVFALVFIFIRDVGIESQLTCFLFSIYIYLKSKSLFENSENQYLRLGLILLLLLSRTDYIYSFVPAIVIFEILTERKKFSLGKIGLFSLAPIILIIFFYLYNLVLFGYPGIISGTIVSSFPDLSLVSNLISFTKPEIFVNQFARTLLIIISITLISLLVFKKSIKLNPLEKCLYGITLGSIVFIFIHLFFNRCGIREWYLTFPLFILGIFISFIVQRFQNLLKYYILISVILFSLVFYMTRIVNSKYDSIYDYAVSIRENIPVNERIFSFDWMGVIGYFSEREFICGDGFVNSFEYLDYIKKRKFLDYINDKKVKYYSTFTYRPVDISTGYFSDINRMKDFNVEGLTFPTNNIVLAKEYTYKHSAKRYEGHFYLIKFPNF